MHQRPCEGQKQSLQPLDRQGHQVRDPGMMGLHVGLRDQLRISARSSGTRNRERNLMGPSLSCTLGLYRE